MDLNDKRQLTYMEQIFVAHAAQKYEEFVLAQERLESAAFSWNAVQYRLKDVEPSVKEEIENRTTNWKRWHDMGVTPL